MNIQEWIRLLLQQIGATPPLEWIAVSLSVTEVLLARANKIWLYPAGIGAVSLTIFIFFEAGLYAECLLNGYYLAMSIYGWWYWVKKKRKPLVKVSFTNAGEWKIVALIVGLGFPGLFLALKYFTPSTVPIADAFVSATAWAGMWLLARRKVENWLLLNISNAAAVPLLLHKELPLYALLTVFLFIVAVTGYFSWRKTARENKSGSGVLAPSIS
ncbi:MAG: nicotinamide riboside transporter PnuC [Pseudobacter sp.]|uniref:nicotinamide riboside transporter PnuC n=1 Tax=Pseudobacter sp. TaxID=2045420 RepID=UPI003F80C050